VLRPKTDGESPIEADLPPQTRWAFRELSGAGSASEDAQFLQKTNGFTNTESSVVFCCLGDFPESAAQIFLISLGFFRRIATSTEQGAAVPA
jgi:hypothetical protein